MTALTKYTRLEAAALWRAAPEDQRREVIVSIGDATITVSDTSDRAITHWSLAAIQRANPGKRPAVFHPEGDPGETLEFSLEDAEMVDAIEKLRRAVERTRPRPGRLRWLGMTLSLLVVAALAVFWLPGALISHTVSVVPAVKRAEIGAALLERIERMTGPACDDPTGQRALQHLRARLGSGPIHVMPDALQGSLHLPGGAILIDRGLIEDYEEPDVAAGFVLAEKTLAERSDPLRDLLDSTGMRASFRLLTTGGVESEALDRYAELLLRQPRQRPTDDAILATFAQRSVRSSPYAYALDVTGETVLPLIEADPMAGREPVTLLTDAQWLRLQNICGG
jgi:hypothetical protein